MTTFKERYPEIEDNDIDLEVVVRDLDSMGQMSRPQVSPRHEARIQYALQERANDQPRQRGQGGAPRRLFVRHRSMAVVAALTLALAAVVGVGYATVSTLNRVFDMDAAHNVLTQNLGTQVNKSQTVAGYTMTVERAYADSNRVLIAYTIRPPADGKHRWNLTPDNLAVVTDSGLPLPDRGYVVASDTGQPDATLQDFDAAGIAGNPKEIHLRLTVRWIDGEENLPASQMATAQQTAAVGTDRGLPTSGQFGSIAVDPANRPNGVQDPYVHDFRVFGPLTFNITVPFVAGHVVTPHQQVTAGGVTLTLERVVISRTETRAYVSGLTPKQSHYVGAVLSGGGWTDEDIDGGSRSVWRAGGTTVFSYLGSFTDKHGTWTLSVKSNPGAAPAGPWTFTFTVP